LVLPLDLPGLHAVNAYLLADDHGFVLVDCGIYGRGRRSPDTQQGAGSDHGWTELVGALDAAGAEPEDVTRLVVTHHHADHYGMAARVLQAAGCELWMHARARQDLDVYRHPESRARRLRALLEAHGVGPDESSELAGYEDWRAYVAAVVDPDVDLHDGQEMAIGTRKWTVLHTPGHARCHVCLWCEDEHLLVSGDHLLPGVTPHIDAGGEAEDPLGDYLSSLERVEDLAPGLVLPGHGRPFEEGAERARATLRHHERRLGAVLQVIRHEPKSARAVSDEIFGASLLDFHRRLALGEALAHLTYLERRGEVERVREDGTLLYSKAARRNHS
jgi:glyoxylase-like metal-dependent hydrolase (beta-lactamase superfamily II)